MMYRTVCANGSPPSVELCSDFGETAIMDLVSLEERICNLQSNGRDAQVELEAREKLKKKLGEYALSEQVAL